MGVDLDTYRARIGSFISRRNVNCDDEKRKIAIIKERFRLKIGLKAVDSWKTRVLECATINASSSFRKCTQGLDFHVSTKLPMSLLSPKSAHCARHSSRAVAMFILTLLVSYLLIKQLLILSGNVEMNPGPLGQQDPTFTLKNITSALKPIVEWKKLGVQLDISGTKIKVIDVNNRGQVEECIIAMVEFWLESDTSCSWMKLVDALNTCDQSVLAENIKSTYCPLHGATNEQGLLADATKGLPDPTVHKHLPTLLPPLPTQSHLPPLGASSSEPALEMSIKELENKFLEVVIACQEDCEYVDIKKMKTYVTLIPAMMKSEHKSFLKDCEPVLVQANSVIEIFIKLNSYWDFINYGILDHLVEKCGRNQTKQLMESFVRDVKAFMENTKLTDFMRIWKGSKEVTPGFSQLIVHHQLNPMQITLSYLDEFRKDFCQYYSLGDVVLMLRRVQFGSVAVVWLIPSHAVEYLCAEMKNPDKVLMQYSVQDVLIDGMSVFVRASLQDRKKKVHEEESNDAMFYGDAAKHGDVEEMVRLLDQGAGINAVDQNGRTALMWASQRGHLECVKKLLDRGAQVNVQDEHGTSSLMLACWNGHAEVVRILVSAGAHVNDQRKDGWSSLMRACVYGHTEVVKILVSAGAHVNDHDKYGNSSLMLICSNGNAEVVTILVSAGAHVNHQNKDGWSSLMRACRYGHAKVVRILLLAGAHINDQEKSSLMEACTNGHAEVVRILVSDGALVNDQNKGLMLACENGHAEVVRILVSAGAHVNDQNKDGTSSLMMACRYGHAKVARILVSARAHVNDQDKDGDTALHWAAQEGHGECVRFLLSVPGIDTNHVNNGGQTPLKLARGYEVLTMFQKYTTSCEDFPVHTYGKVIMCGNSGAGKSTLTEAIIECSQFMSDEGGGDEQPVTKQMRKPAQALTAGIISHRVKSVKANMTIYDLAGHREYYSSHSSILECISNTTPSIFLLLVNLLHTIKDITEQLYYWSAMIGNVCSKCSEQSSIIVVGTHADCICDEGKVEFLCTQIEQVARDATKQHIFVQFTALNVTSFREQVFGSFLSLLQSTIHEVRLRCPAISLTCHVMYAFLNEKVPADQDAIPLSQLLTLLSQEKTKVLPTDATEVSEYLQVLSDKGFIVFFESDTKHVDSWIVIRPEALLEKVNGILFAPSNFREHIPIASNTGVIPISILKRHFPEPKYNIDMITQFLVRFELCQPITLTYTNTTSKEPPSSSCPDLFFPPLVSASRPDDAIIPDNAFIWQICCSKINQSFSPRFLHVLVTRTADQFPLPTVEPCLVPDLEPYNRSCTVWSRGISWMSKEGFSTVIEMREDFQCLLCAVSTSDKTSIDYSKLILSVINVIKVTCDEFCPSVSRVELITCPPDVTSDHVAATVECEELKKMILKAGEATVTDSSRKKQVNIIEWRKVEPQLPHLIGADQKQALNEFDHANILSPTKSACPKWRAIGRQLGFTTDELNAIVREPGRNGDEDDYEAMLRRWLDWAPPNHTPPSLQSLLSALRAAGKERQANDLVTKYKFITS